MRCKTIVSSAFALALLGIAGGANAGDSDEEEEEEIVTLKRKGDNDDKVQVIVIQNDDIQNDDRRERRKKKKRKMPAVEGEAPPEGYHTETTNLRGLWIAGISTFAPIYALTVLSGGIADAWEGTGGYYAAWTLLPIAGPFVVAAHGGDNGIGGGAKVYFVAMGLLQATGMGMFIGGLAAKKSVWVPDEYSMTPQISVGAGNISLRQNF